ncbi:COX15/CtaA family protein [Dermabacteraceae bacterium P13101]
MPETVTQPDRLTRFFFWGNLFCQIGIIVTGGVVRLTKSGLGCTSWPGCEPGQFLPVYHPESGLHPFIEAGNRALTGVLVIFAVGLLAMSLLHLKHKGKGFLLLSCVPLILTFVQAIIGMVTVIYHLHPGLVAPHFIVSPILVAFSAVLVYRLYEGDGQRRRLYPAAIYFLYAALAAAGFIVIFLGTVVTGSGPHSGDATRASRLPFDPRTVAWLHADAVMLFMGLLVGVLAILYIIRAQRPAKQAAWLLVALSLVQGAIGYGQYFLGLPELLVGMHLLGAGLFAALIAYLGAALYTWRQ